MESVGHQKVQAFVRGSSDSSGRWLLVGGGNTWGFQNLGDLNI